MKQGPHVPDNDVGSQQELDNRSETWTFYSAYMLHLLITICVIGPLVSHFNRALLLDFAFC